MITIKKTDGTPITLLPLLDGTTVQIRVANTAVTAKTVKFFVFAKDGAAPVPATDSNGKEISLESWVSISPAGANTWAAIGEAALFPALFKDLATGYSTDIGAGLCADYDIKVTIPAEFSTSGIAYFSVAALGGEPNMGGESTVSGEITASDDLDPSLSGCYMHVYSFSAPASGEITFSIAASFAPYIAIMDSEYIRSPENYAVIAEAYITMTVPLTEGELYHFMVMPEFSEAVGTYTLTASGGGFVRIANPWA